MIDPTVVANFLHIPPPILISAVGGLLSAVAVDYHILESSNAWNDLSEFNWKIASVRYCIGFLVGLATGFAGYESSTAPFITGATTGFASAAMVDLHALQSAKSLNDNVPFDIKIAVRRWIKGAVTGAASSSLFGVK